MSVQNSDMPLRMSSYTIPVKLEDEEGKYMLIHGYTGAIDIVSEEMFYGIKSPGNVTFSNEILTTLQRRGYITTKTKEEEREYVARMARALTRKGKILYSDFTWMVTYNCNFRCPYCFENRTHKDSSHKIVFSKDMVDAAYSAIDTLQPLKRPLQNTMSLYGGEPLLAENKEIVSYIVEEGCKRGYKFVAITNGYEVENFLDLLSADKIFKMQITIDGIKEEHDKRRVHYQGICTFDKIISNIELALRKGILINVRMNMSVSNENQYEELKQFFLNKGFYNYKTFDFYGAMITDSNSINDSDRGDINIMSPQKFANTLKNNLSLFKFDDNSLYRNIFEAITKKRPLHFKSVTCASQTNGYVLDPLGHIYPCWEVVGNREHLEGHYSKEGVVWNEETLSKWKEMDISQRKECSLCIYALLCGGGCPYHYLVGNDSNCIIFKMLFHAIARKAYNQVKLKK